MTYRELNQRANRLARELVEAGVHRGDNVAMMLERSFELIISQLAIAKVGAAYVPIDVKAPLDRQMYIASDSGAKLLITDETREVPSHIDVAVFRFRADDEKTADEKGMYIESM
jgi:non-ribosomal peptide synthetase component F